jgi:hypothetical protein
MDWFEKLTGFRETSYADTKAKLEVENGQLRSLVNGKSYRTGELELVSLKELRNRVKKTYPSSGKSKVSAITGDIRRLHRSPGNAGALFQVASQFNLLEMVAPGVTPEDGVGRYEGDHTQGPACAMAAGAATIYRNYFAPVGDKIGQTSSHQLNGLAGLGVALSNALDIPVSALWKMQNGYALCSKAGLDHITSHLGSLSPIELDLLRERLQIGIHSNVEVTDVAEEPRPLVCQAFCSALPVAYTQVPRARWTGFASLVLEAAYEATLLGAALNSKNGGSNVVLLTHLGGGAFGNEQGWITNAIRRALTITSRLNLNVKIVSFSHVSEDTSALISEFK